MKDQLVTSHGSEWCSNVFCPPRLPVWPQGDCRPRLTFPQYGWSGAVQGDTPSCPHQLFPSNDARTGPDIPRLWSDDTTEIWDRSFLTAAALPIRSNPPCLALVPVMQTAYSGSPVCPLAAPQAVCCMCRVPAYQLLVLPEVAPVW